jgi:3-deoxy-D-manno-octulosonate 8-phosphate phosphatase (KDO 8-P phosphatase)
LSNFKERLHNIRCFVFDVDGVLTNGQLLITHEGQQLRSMNIKDGYALQLAVKEGYQVFIISGAVSEGVIKRLNGLGIKDVFTGVPSKKKKLDELLDQHNLTYNKVLYMGDDMPDLEPMQHCEVACCPSDAVQQVRNASIYISEIKGGDGCVRDVIEQVLTLHGKWS